jgi:hypothetical protein
MTELLPPTDAGLGVVADRAENPKLDVAKRRAPVLAKSTVDALAARGEMVANQDPLAMALREVQAAGEVRRGFDVGMGASEGQTSPDPGNQRIHDALTTVEQAGFRAAVSFAVERNDNAIFAARGAAVARANPLVEAARTTKEPPGLYWLGFDVATGIFGDPALGALGNTQTGPGALKIRDSLSDAGKRGFNASMRLHLGPPPLGRRGKQPV